MTSSLDMACLKPKSKSFSDAKTASPTQKGDTKMPGTTTTLAKPSAREKKAVYKISRM